MNKQDFDEKFNELLKQCNKACKKRAEEILKSGAVDLESAENTYAFPRTVLIDCLISSAGVQKHFLGRNHLKDLENIKNF
ncbi:MAG: hypothetical protein PHW33_01635 [Candidatus Portnoybacteria bacterium]|jgi:predicted carbohydrate-binding protein with CBM5 and CBM33 domain|nr:hypothetical protein [Candidatus Portnoybacteria bacterium]